MSIQQSNPAVPLGAATTFRAVSAAKAARAALRAWRVARAARRALDALTDEQLADLGLDRGEILAAARAIPGR